MLIRPKVPSAAAPPTLMNINRTRARMQKRRTRSSVRQKSNETRRMFYPSVNRSFAVYNDITAPLPRSNFESFSLPKDRNVSLGDIAHGKKYANPARHLNSVERFEHGQLKEHTDFVNRGKTKLEHSQALLERAKSEMKLGQFSDALHYFKRVLKFEGTNPEALYSRALCFMHLKQHRMAIPDLLTLSRDAPLFDKQVYVALAMCFVAGNDVSTAVRHLSNGLSKFPKFAEGRVLRGQLYLKLQKHEKALQDFAAAIKIDSDEGSAYIGIGDAYKKIGEVSAAEVAYSSAVRCKKSNMEGLLKRATLFIEQESDDKALRDLDLVRSIQYLSQNTSDPQASYLKGKILLKRGEEQEAFLSFEQVLKYDTEANYTDEAIFHLTSIKVRQRDFYGASHTLSRVVSKGQNLGDLELYVEAVLNLMKRKFKEGARSLSKVIKSSSSVLAEYVSASYAYRGYGYACLDKLQDAVQDFDHVMKEGKLDKVTAFNRCLCKGLLAGHELQWPTSLSYFSKAAGLFPRNIEPVFYRSVGLLAQAREIGPLENSAVTEVYELVNKSLALRDTESELYYARALLEYSSGLIEEAISDLEMAIEKSEDNVVNHFMLRGECYAILGLYKEAFQDFSIVVQLDEGNSRGYLNRGRMAYLLEDTSQAFIDFQKLILTDPVRHR